MLQPLAAESKGSAAWAEKCILQVKKLTYTQQILSYWARIKEILYTIEISFKIHNFCLESNCNRNYWPRVPENLARHCYRL